MRRGQIVEGQVRGAFSKGKLACVESQALFCSFCFVRASLFVVYLRFCMRGDRKAGFILLCKGKLIYLRLCLRGDRFCGLRFLFPLIFSAGY